jgi:hypothetical protein
MDDYKAQLYMDYINKKSNSPIIIDIEDDLPF